MRMPRQVAEEPERRVAANGNKLPRRLPEGIVVTDVCDKKWKIGKSIGLGGFGEIYLASDDLGGSVGQEAQYVAKVEAHSSGPLFVEMNFYLRAARCEMVDEWVAKRDLKFLGMPFYLGSGSFWYKGERFRFLIIPRYSHDLEKTFQERGQHFHLKTVLSVALQVMDTLEFIHTQGYVHADIKASNLLVGLDRDEQDRVFLVDFGLAHRYKVEGVHKEFRPDLRKAHDGTLEFTSRDAHQGAHSRRGDLEVLGYNLLKWLCSRLPWESDTAAPDPDYMHAQKEGFMKDPAGLVRACFPNSQPPAVLEKYLKYVTSLGFETTPDYEHCRKLFRQGLKEAGFKDDGRLELYTEPKATLPKARKKAEKRRALDEPENIAELKPKKVVRVTPAQPCRPKNFNTRATRSSPTSPMLRSRDHFDWEAVLQSNPEKQFYKRNATESLKKEKQYSTPECRSSPSARSMKNLQEMRKNRGLDNPTPAMLQMMGAKKQKSRSNSGQTTPNKRGRSGSISLPPEDILTPAMEEVIQQRQNRCSRSNSPESPLPRMRSRKSVASSPQSSRSTVTQRRTRAMSHHQAVASCSTHSASRPATLDLRSTRSDSDDEKEAKSKHVSLESEIDIHEVTPNPKTQIRGRLRERRKNRQHSSTPSLSPTKSSPCALSTFCVPDLREQRATRRAKREGIPSHAVSNTLLNNDMQFRFKVLIPTDEGSSYAPSTVSSDFSHSSGSVYEPSEVDDLESLDSLHIKLRRAGKKNWRVDNCRRVLKMPSGIHRRVTRNCGKL